MNHLRSIGADRQQQEVHQAGELNSWHASGPGQRLTTLGVPKLDTLVFPQSCHNGVIVHERPARSGRLLVEPEGPPQLWAPEALLLGGAQVLATTATEARQPKILGATMPTSRVSQGLRPSRLWLWHLRPGQDGIGVDRTSAEGGRKVRDLERNQVDVQTLKLRPTLIVGVGRQGGQLLEDVCQQLNEHYGPGLDLPVLGLLWLDHQPAQAQAPKAAEIVRLPLNLDEPEALIEKLSDSAYEHLHRWWYPGWASLAAAGVDLSTSRPAGRLSFFVHYARLRAQLQESLARIRDPETAPRLLASMHLKRRNLAAQIQFDLPTQVFVVADACDGLAGMLIDLGFLIRELVPDGAISRTACLLLHPTRVHANGYALLKELNHYMLGDHGFEAEWEVGKRIRPVCPGYDSCLVQESGSELLAHYFCQEFTIPELGEYRRSLRLNVKAAGSLAVDELRQRFAGSFDTLGLARIRFAHRALQETCARRLAAEGLLSLVQGPELNPEPEVLGEDKGVRRSWLLSLIQSQVDDSTLVQEIERWGLESRAALRIGKRFQLQRILQEGARWLEKDLLPQVTANQEALRQNEEVRLLTRCLQAVQSDGSPLNQVLGMLAELRARLTRWGETYRRQLAGLADLQRDLTGKVARQLAELTRLEKRSNWDGRRGILLSYQQERILQLHLGNLDNPGLFMVRLLQETYQQAASLCQHLHQSMATEMPYGTISGQLQMLHRGLLALSEDLDAQVHSSRACESSRLSWNLCPPERLWGEVYPRYVGSEFPAQLLRNWLSGRQEPLDVALAREGFSQDWVAHCLGVFHRLPIDFSLLQQLPAISQCLEPAMEASQGVLARLPPASKVHLLGIPAPPGGLSPLEKTQVDRASEQLLHLLQQASSGPATPCLVSHGEELVLLSEAVSLPVHVLLDLTPWRDAYVTPYMLGEALHIEGHDQAFSDLKTLDDSELASVREANEAFLLGRILKQLTALDGEWFWTEVCPWGSLVHPLGESHRLLLKLSRASRLRARLLGSCRQLLNERIEKGSLSEVLELAQGIVVEKQLSWSSGQADLDFLRDLEVRIQTCEVYLAHESMFAEKVVAPQ